jgi:hypothetical protein
MRLLTLPAFVLAFLSACSCDPAMCTDCGSPDAGIPDPIDHGIPDDYPQLNAQYLAHMTWRPDTSGSESVPNETFGSIDELPGRQGLGTFGVMYAPEVDSFYMRVADSNPSEALTILLAMVEPGTYDAASDELRIDLLEQRPMGMMMTSFGEGASATVDIVGTSETALWGSFTARLCGFPDCWTMYEGRFAATLPP